MWVLANQGGGTGGEKTGKKNSQGTLGAGKRGSEKVACHPGVQRRVEKTPNIQLKKLRKKRQQRQNLVRQEKSGPTKREKGR